MRKIPLFSHIVLLALASPAIFAEEAEDMEKISILGSKEKALTLPGSAYVIDEEDLERFKHNDIHRILKDVPGVNLQEEDGVDGKDGQGKKFDCV